MPIVYVKGDATQPQGSGPKLVVHNVNSKGYWGKGFVLALSSRWPLAEETYHLWAQKKPVDETFPGRCETSGPFQLGEAQFVLVGPRLWVGSIIGQHGIGMGPNNRPPIRYDALQQGLKKVYRHTQSHHGMTVHMPRMGSGLAGGRWDAVEKLVSVELAMKGVHVTVYDLP